MSRESVYMYTLYERTWHWVQTVVVSRAYLIARGIDSKQVIDEFLGLNPRLNVVCTLGRDGVMAKFANDDLLRIPAIPVNQVVDSRGAGDCFIAALIDRLSRGHSFGPAIEFANQLAADKIRHEGIVFSRDFVQE